ncbi:cyclic nucleotide-binding domain-containing protein [Acidaminobacter sp. JC074]|uniref:cyclic nucleotide-binding domain-containing protein n=1 Tax=Acidaminobacter sp. JC074 TaxID=2530199 RepID=UPI001F0F12AC|nr:cyclic nucleotide-binding domain-containing protein [Acidaminobacter sp. JC074]MCH4887971.1 cyclic nucleotide-binding domain-containing protein [Acidaminobacter sp. JC074]
MDLKALIDQAPSQIKDHFIYRTHLKDDTITFADEKNDYLYILTEGQADVIFQTYEGAMRTIYNYQPYSCFGELELFNEDAKTHEIICKTESKTLSLHKDYVFIWMQSDFNFTKYLIEQLSSKLLESSKSLSAVTLLNVNDRLLNCIYTHSLLGDL